MHSSFFAIGITLMLLTYDGVATTCNDDTLTLYANDTVLNETMVTYITNNKGALLPAASSDGKSFSIEANYIGTYSDTSFAAYKEACSNATGIMCYIDMHISAKYQGVQADFQYCGLPTCFANSCSKANITDTPNIPPTVAAQDGTTVSVQIFQYRASCDAPPSSCLAFESSGPVAGLWHALLLSSFLIMTWLLL